MWDWMSAEAGYQQFLIYNIKFSMKLREVFYKNQNTYINYIMKLTFVREKE